MTAASDGEVGEADVDGDIADGVAEEVGSAGDRPASSSLHAETTANRNVPVAKKVSPSQIGRAHV